MNMHGIMAPVERGGGNSRTGLIDRVGKWLWQRRGFLTLVVVPTLLVATYLYLFASDQYETEAHYLVHTAANTQPAPTGLGQALSFVTGQTTQNEAMSVADYLTSHDVVATLRKEDGLVARFHRSNVDPLSRLRFANPTPERLLRYYLGQVSVHFDNETGITTLKVHAFTPQDSYDIARKLLVLGEHRVNELNIRSYNDAISLAQRQLAAAEDDLEALQLKMTGFRQSRRDIDPEASGKSQIGLVSNLTGQLATARASLNAMGSMIDSSSPQYRAMESRVGALQAQVNAQSSRLAGGGSAIAGDLSDYQALQLRQEFLSKRYEAAAASLEKARQEALRQQLYVIRVVDANRPVKALFPERVRILATVAIALLLIYSIGWLILAGVKEHAA